MNLIDCFLIAAPTAINAGEKIMEIYNNNDFQIEYKHDNSPLTVADKKSNSIIINALNEFNIPIISEESEIPDYSVRKNWDYFWLIDPLDGTKEFIKRNGEFTVNIALIKNQQPILGIIYIPVTKELYFGIEAIGSFKYNGNKLPDNWADIRKDSIPLPSKNFNHLKVLVSRSHQSSKIEKYLNELRCVNPNIKTISKGSSLKLCSIASEEAQIYPRFTPTMEWDIAAGHAIVKFAGGLILQIDTHKELKYNKQNLQNPCFLCLSRNIKTISFYFDNALKCLY